MRDVHRDRLAMGPTANMSRRAVREGPDTKVNSNHAGQRNCSLIERRFLRETGHSENGQPSALKTFPEQEEAMVTPKRTGVA